MPELVGNVDIFLITKNIQRRTILENHDLSAENSLLKIPGQSFEQCY
jgi:hypothetical protein